MSSLKALRLALDRGYLDKIKILINALCVKASVIQSLIIDMLEAGANDKIDILDYLLTLISATDINQGNVVKACLIGNNSYKIYELLYNKGVNFNLSDSHYCYITLDAFIILNALYQISPLDLYKCSKYSPDNKLFARLITPGNIDDMLLIVAGNYIIHPVSKSNECFVSLFEAGAMFNHKSLIKYIEDYNVETLYLLLKCGLPVSFLGSNLDLKSKQALQLFNVYKDQISFIIKQYIIEDITRNIIAY